MKRYYKTYDDRKNDIKCGGGTMLNDTGKVPIRQVIEKMKLENLLYGDLVLHLMLL